jgi:hypothetical protein
MILVLPWAGKKMIKKNKKLQKIMTKMSDMNHV